MLGEIIDISWTTTNQGTDNQYGDFFERIYISDDEYWDESDIEVNEYYEPVPYYNADDYFYSDDYDVPQLVAGGSKLRSTSITLIGTNGELTSGDRYLIIVSDYRL